MASTSIEPLSYVDFEPRVEWFKGKETDTIIVDVSGFKREQLKVLINTAGNLKISGERPIEGRHWSRFLRSFTIPKSINMKGIQAKFDGDEGLLYVILPISFSVPELPPPLPTKAPDSASTVVTSAHQEGSSVLGNEETPKMQEKVAAEEEEAGRISGEKTTADYNKEDRNSRGSGRKGSVIASVISKQKLVILSVILGVMVSLGFAVYLSYRALKGL